MITKYLIPAVLVFTFACNNDVSKKDEEALKEKLPASLVNNPRTLNETNPDKIDVLGKLVFADTIHNFGILHEGEVATYEFTFTNGGQKDLIINEAKASCGCTVADYPTHPFKPGESDKIKVTFDSEGKGGMNERAVVVTTNGNPAIYNLIIQAQVNEK